MYNDWTEYGDMLRRSHGAEVEVSHGALNTRGGPRENVETSKPLEKVTEFRESESLCTIEAAWNSDGGGGCIKSTRRKEWFAARTRNVSLACVSNIPMVREGAVFTCAGKLTADHNEWPYTVTRRFLSLLNTSARHRWIEMIGTNLSLVLPILFHLNIFNTEKNILQFWDKKFSTCVARSFQRKRLKRMI